MWVCEELMDQPLDAAPFEHRLAIFKEFFGVIDFTCQVVVYLFAPVVTLASRRDDINGSIA